MNLSYDGNTQILFVESFFGKRDPLFEEVRNWMILSQIGGKIERTSGRPG